MRLLRLFRGRQPGCAFWCSWGFHKWKAVSVCFYSNRTAVYTQRCERPDCGAVRSVEG